MRNISYKFENNLWKFKIKFARSWGKVPDLKNLRKFIIKLFNILGNKKKKNCEFLSKIL